MWRASKRSIATIVVALASLTTSGCIGGDAGKPSTKARPRNSAVAHCVGHECRVRVVCKGRVYIRRGAPPVRIRTFKSAFRTSVIADFAGSADDAVIRC